MWLSEWLCGKRAHELCPIDKPIGREELSELLRIHGREVEPPPSKLDNQDTTGCT